VSGELPMRVRILSSGRHHDYHFAPDDDVAIHRADRIAARDATSSNLEVHDFQLTVQV
jgi:hypothetical protein